MKQFLQNIQGIDGYLIFSMLVFISFFIGLLIWVLTVDKQYISNMKKLPLDHNNN